MKNKWCLILGLLIFALLFFTSACGCTSSSFTSAATTVGQRARSSTTGAGTSPTYPNGPATALQIGDDGAKGNPPDDDLTFVILKIQ